VRALFHRRTLRGEVSFSRALGPQLLRAGASAPIAVIDHEDIPLINRNNLFLLDRCHTYFKRELPVDRWRLFLKTEHANLPTPRFRMRARNLARIAKLQPISLGLPRPSLAAIPTESIEKTVDVFFAGQVEGSSSVRARGMAELAVLRERGLTVDVPSERMPPAEFYRRAAAAWLTWSPEGLGWDCFRHYEACACESVPVISQPTIERHRPLVAGEHAFYYDVEPGGLTRAIMAAIADKPRLSKMAQAARRHVLAHHTPSALARSVVERSLGR
jgi:hypothetical protein